MTTDASEILLWIALICFVAAGIEAGRRRPPAWYNLFVALGLATGTLFLIL